MIAALLLVQGSMESEDQGRMTSESLTAMLRMALRARFPDLNVDGLDKVGMLSAAVKASGWRAAFELGTEVKGLRAHPVVAALASASYPELVLDRWLRLERFGHSRNRTELLSTQPGERTTIVLHHVALDGGSIHFVSDLFIWGVLVGLMELAGIEVCSAAIADSPEAVAVSDRDLLHESTAEVRGETSVLQLTCASAAAHPPQAPALTESRGIALRLSALLRDDLLRRWDLNTAASALGLSRRSLQRQLSEAKSTFSETLLRTRVDAAEQMMRDSRLKLGEIGFCAGFADQAHFTRSFRRFYDVPPSAFRDLVLSAETR